MTTTPTTGFRVSPQQERLWRRGRGAGDGSPLRSEAVLEVDGELTLEALRGALERLVERHEILRTRLRPVAGMALPVQVIDEPGGSPALDDEDLSGLDEAALAAARRRFFEQLLDVEEGQGWAAALHRLPGGGAQILLLASSLLLDASSMVVWAAELGRELAGEAPSGEPLQYADAAEALQDWLDDEEGEHFWTARAQALAGLPSPAPEAVEGDSTPDGLECLELSLDRALLERIDAASAAREISADAILLAAWLAALQRSTGEAFLPLAVELDGRTAEDLDEALGAFARPLPWLAEIAEERPLAATVEATAWALAEMESWQDSYPPAVDSVESDFAFVVEPERRTLAAGSSTLRLISATSRLQPFAARLAVAREGGALAARLEWAPGRLSRPAAEGLAERWRSLLQAIVEEPEKRLGDLSLLSQAEAREWASFNATERGLAPGPSLVPGLSLVEWIDQRAERRLEGTAVVGPDGAGQSFGELLDESRRVARHLRNAGAGPGSVVALLMRRGLRLPAALLGVLRSGAAYLALDPDYPEERLRFCLRDSGAGWLIDSGGDSATETLLVAHPEEIRRISPEDWAGEETGSVDLPAIPLAAPAYVLYTSGSTGRPKGVVISHASLVHYVAWAAEEYLGDAQGGVPLHSSLGFDLTVTSLWPPLVRGSAVHLIPEGRGVEALATSLATGEPYALVKITPAHLQALAATWSAAAPRVEVPTWVVGGEALLPATAAAVTRWAPGGRVINEYGPTEATVGCAVFRQPADLTVAETGEPGALPIGRPIANHQIHIVNRGLRRLPPQAPGELLVGGPGLAQGYLGRPGRTASAFVPDPFSGRPGSRLYRTGDRARLREDGQLDFLGRGDGQIKVRGYRLELGEIEERLAEHPEVRQAAVVAFRDPETANDLRLAAYWVASEDARQDAGEDRGGPISSSGLRSHLAGWLPEAALPQAFVLLPRLPLTAHGKVDRDALAEPDWQAAVEAPFRAPRNLEEELLAEIWAGVLKRDRVGLDDHFFALGGDSIRVVQMLARLEERGYRVTLETVFEHPTIASLAASLGAEPETARSAGAFELIADEDRHRLPAGLVDAYPLSRLQSGMLFHSELGEGSGVFNDLHSFELRGPWDEAALGEAIAALLTRHPVLRTSFALERFSEPLQLVHEAVSLPLEVEDLRHLGPDAAAAAGRQFLDEARLEGYAWEEAPLLRCRAHRLTDETFRFTFGFHHSILDGWSAAALLTELFGSYQARAEGDAAWREPEAPSALYRHFVEAERAALASPEAMEFWDQALAGAEGLRLTRPSRGQGSGGPAARVMEIPLDVEVGDGLRALARRAAVPLKSVLLAAHLRVLGRLTGRRDLITGLVSHGRPAGGDGDRVLGLFLNSLPLRLRLAGGTWEELAHQCFEAERALVAHRRYPLAEIQRRFGAAELFDVLFNFIHYHVYQGLEESPGLELADRQGYEEVNYPLTVHFAVQPGDEERLMLALNWREPEVGESWVEEASGFYLRALAAMAADPEARYDAQDLLTETQRRQTLGMAGPPLASGGGGTLSEAFARQAARTPEAAALVWRDAELDYASLLALADRLAATLRNLGIEPEETVGLCLQRSPALAVALLGVLRAGGAYLPLDPAYPPSRLTYCLGDSETRLVLVDAGSDLGVDLAARLQAEGARVLAIDGEGRCVGAAPAEESSLPAPILHPDQQAYVIYTSGSTGEPKGVSISHRAAMTLVSWAAKEFSAEQRESVLASTSICFDLSVFELFLPWSEGGRVVLVDDLLAVPEIEHGVSLVNTVPSAAAALLEAGAWPPEASTVILAGEPLRRRLVDALYEQPAVETVYNLYGPTEDATYATGGVVPRGVATEPTLGRSLGGRRAYVVDGDLLPAPPGVAGELLLGGSGLARGYVGRPAATALRFVPDALSGQSGQRLYRTGDRGRLDRGGELEFLGRFDHQVKLRGFRIEPGEVEAALLAQPQVVEAVVEVRSTAAGSEDLMAWVEAAPGQGLAEELEEALRRRLPAHLVPAAVVCLESLPRTPNGKIDRRALATPSLGDAEPAAYAAPRNAIEVALCRLFGEVLASPRVSVHDSFFELGGHSLLATQLVARTRRVFEVDLPLRSLFDAPTPALLATAVAERRGGPSSRHASLQPAPGDGPWPLSAPQRRLWLLDRIDGGSSAYNVPLAVRLEGALDREALRQALDAVMERHAVLRAVFPQEGDEASQRIEAPTGMPWTEVDLREDSAELRQLAAREASRPFDLARGPLARARLFRLGEEDHVLQVTFHHIVSDGWSLGLFIQETSALYEAIRGGRPSPLEPLELQYTDFAVWQDDWLKGDGLRRQLDYWRGRLAEAPTVLDLPFDRPRPPLQTLAGAMLSRHSPAALSAGLHRLGHEVGATLFMVLLAGFKALLHRYTGQRDFVVGTDVAGRLLPETESMIGFFVNELALRTRFEGDPGFGPLVEAVRQSALGAFDHQEVPFERLVEALQEGERDLSRSPIFQVALVLQELPGTTAELPGLKLSALPVDRSTAKFDLTLIFYDRPDALVCEAEYNTDLFDASTVGRLLGHLERLLDGAARRPESPLAALPLLAEAETRQLLVEWQGGEAPEALDSTFDEALRSRAAASGGAIALSFAGEDWTYAEVDGAADGVASFLRLRGVGPGEVVALIAERDAAFGVALLGIQRARAAYLPLSPTDPGRRILEILASSGARLVLCAEPWAEALRESLASAPGEVATEVADLREALAQPGEAASSRPQAGDLAYVLYTSGSTGKPKGAMLEHGGMLNHLWAKARDLDLGPEDVVAQTATQTFDISIWQYLVALLVGGRTEVFGDEIAHDPMRLVQEVEARSVTVLETVPSLLRLIVEDLEQRPAAARPRLSALRWMIPTGEALPPALAGRWLNLYPEIPLVNAYGPTECSDDVTHHRIDRAPAPEAVSVPIGKPIHNTQLYVVDPRFVLAPLGVAGELLVGGVGVGRGYLAEPRRTALTFVPDPFSGAPGARLYRTGDLAAWSAAHGTLDFLGRIDHQVKVRGFRIELGEIEARLAAHPAVSECAVLARQDGGEASRLVAYWSLAEDGGGAAEAEGRKVEAWESIFDEVYAQGERSDADQGVNLRVWVSSYTGLALPDDEIEECIADSVERIQALRPRRVLEIGCGTGLLLERLAGDCETYWGTDLSDAVLDDLRRRLALRGDLAERVRLLHRPAEDLDGVPRRGFDTVILNEVAQYFPSTGYLMKVLKEAVEAVEPGGRIFVGGVRNHALMDAFHASVQLFRSADEVSLAELRERIVKAKTADKELLVDPSFFAELQGELPRISRALLRLKGGAGENELTKFRYDVILEVETSVAADDGAGEPYAGLKDGLDEVHGRLEKGLDGPWMLRGIPNARLTQDLRVAQRLIGADGEDRVEDLRREIAEGAARRQLGVDPHALKRQAALRGHDAVLRWPEGGDGGTFDAVFYPLGEGSPLDEAPATAFVPVSRPRSQATWNDYGNQPAGSADAEERVPELRRHLAERLPEYMVPAAFVALSALPKTSSGKIDRKALPAPEQVRPELGEAYVAPAGRAQEILAEIWRDILHLDRIGVRDNFFELGGDSILSIQVVGRAGQAGLRITPRQMFQHPTVEALAQVAVSAAPVGEQGPVVGEAPLLPIQRWFFEEQLEAASHWNQSLLLASPEALDPAALRRAAHAVTTHHDGLRARVPEPGAPRALELGPADLDLFATVDLSALDGAAARGEVTRLCTTAQRSLDLERGPLARFLHFSGTPDLGSRLLVVAHHLVVDGVSWRILLGDLEQAYGASVEGRPIELGPKSASLRDWGRVLEEKAASPGLDEELPYWLDQLPAAGEGLPLDDPAASDRVGAARSRTSALDEEGTTTLLERAPDSLKARPEEILLAALGMALAEWVERPAPSVVLEGHGRDLDLGLGDIDLSRTVGWLTVEHPLRLPVRRGEVPIDALKAVKEAVRRIPGQGLGYGLLRYSKGSPELREREMPPVIFNYLGRLDLAMDAETRFQVAAEERGREQDENQRRPYELEVNAAVVEGRLRVDWGYSGERFEAGTLRRLEALFLSRLEELLELAAEDPGGALTPSDFAGARLDQGQLDEVLSRLASGPGGGRERS